MEKRKILGITGIRSDYDLTSSLYKELTKSSDFEFKLLVGGAHLSPTYGQSIKQIEDDGIPVLGRIESLIDADSLSSRLKTASIMLLSSIDIVASWNPDLIIYPGDREEVWIGALLGAYLEIPTVHIYGGDHTMSGYVDNPVRHAVTKLSSVHWVTTEEHRDRVLALGESPDRVHVIGSLSLDNFCSVVPQPRQQLFSDLGINGIDGKYAIVIFHPVTSEKSIAGEIMTSILECLRDQGIGACVGYPNTDPANKSIIEAMDRFSNEAGFFFYKNLSRTHFLSLYKNADFIIGNSSSGIMEAATIPIPAINLGPRQSGRAAGQNVISCDSTKEAIRMAIGKAQSPVFKATIKGMRNLYGDGNSTVKALEILRNTDFSLLRLKTEDPLHGR